MVSRVPTSSAYWNLRAEQVMDKVFAKDAFRANQPPLVAVDIDVEEPSLEPPKQSGGGSGSERPPTSRTEVWLIPLLSGVAAAGMICSGWLIGSWRQSESQLAQERNLRLIERLRTPPPAEPIQTPDSPAQPITPTPPAQELTGEAPPPPEPEWVTSLEPLTLPIRRAPESGAAQAPLVSSAPSPGPAVARPADAPMPQLTGVVQGPGGTSSAIFQLSQSSLSVGLGDGIGNSGWTLESISETGAVIHRNGERRNLSVGGVF